MNWSPLIFRVLVLAAVFGAGAGFSHHQDKLKYGAQIATINAQSAAREKAISDAAALQANAALGAQRQMEAKLALLDQIHTQELNHAKANNARLRAAVAAGTTRLRIAGTCPAAGGKQMSSATGAASVGHGASVELAADARQDYYTLRDQLAADQAKIGALQDYVKNVCLQR